MNAEASTILVPAEQPKRDRPTLPMPMPADANPMQMLAVAVSQGADIDKLQKLMDLRDRWEASEARKAFNKAFAEFKAEAVQIIRNQTVTDGPLKGKKYAELSDVVDAVTPALSKHGFSHSWKTTKDEKDWIEVTCTLTHVGGHSELEPQGGPPDTGGAKNPIQARASTRSYLERYTLLAVTGLAAKNQDTDGNTIKVKLEPEPEGFGEWADNLETIVANGHVAFDEAWAKADPKYRRYVVKFEEEWFNGLRAKAKKVKS